MIEIWTNMRLSAQIITIIVIAAATAVAIIQVKRYILWEGIR